MEAAGRAAEASAEAEIRMRQNCDCWYCQLARKTMRDLYEHMDKLMRGGIAVKVGPHIR